MNRSAQDNEHRRQCLMLNVEAWSLCDNRAFKKTDGVKVMDLFVQKVMILHLKTQTNVLIVSVPHHLKFTKLHLLYVRKSEGLVVC